MKILKGSTHRSLLDKIERLEKDQVMKSNEIERLENELNESIRILHSMSRRFNHEVDKIVESLKNPSGDIHNPASEAKRIKELGGILSEETVNGKTIRNRKVFVDAFVELKEILNAII